MSDSGSSVNAGEISTVRGFHDMVCGQKTAPIFRGEPKATFPLLPKIGRCYRYHSKYLDAPDTGRPFSLADEVAAFKEFRQRAMPYVNHVPRDDWEWLALAQHHGLPTRLLDWTENPLVAAFFACHDGHGSDAVIYVLDERQFNVPLYAESPFNITETKVFVPSHITPRIAAQGALFTIHPKPDEEFRSPHLQRWVIKESCLLEIWGMVEKYGVHHASLLPGLDGVAQYLRDRWFLYSE